MQFTKAGFSLSQLRKYLNGNIDVPLIPKVNGNVNLGSGAFGFHDLFSNGTIYSNATSLHPYHKEVCSVHTDIVSGNLQPFFTINQGANTCTTIQCDLMFYNTTVQPAYFAWLFTTSVISADSAGVDKSIVTTLYNANYNINPTVLAPTLNPTVVRTGSNGVLTFRIQPVVTGSMAPANVSCFGHFMALGLDAASLAPL